MQHDSGLASGIHGAAEGTASGLQRDQGRGENAPQRSAEWLEARRQRLTASDFAAAIGINPYKSRIELWKEKTGRIPPFAGNAATDYGTENEPNAISAYEIETGRLVWPVGLRCHPHHDWLAASADGFTGADGCVECKCPLGGSPHSRIPEYYIPQVQGVLHCTGRMWCDFVSWSPSEVNIIRVERCDKYWDWMFPMLEEFWRYVKTDTQPPRLKRKPIFQGGK